MWCLIKKKKKAKLKSKFVFKYYICNTWELFIILKVPIEIAYLCLFKNGTAVAAQYFVAKKLHHFTYISVRLSSTSSGKTEKNWWHIERKLMDGWKMFVAIIYFRHIFVHIVLVFQDWHIVVVHFWEPFRFFKSYSSYTITTALSHRYFILQ